ncbi:PAS/PAC sensor hybrid histidine kinase (plasmid) [Leptolyngbya boryana NIES-2135]|jgi:PAS domain S-box-containing protein|uniref:Circadian input-output histidine kinase CikA n=1 Tax=Leptolyngbya boryana NIES-2135 TaxID=1973484 RepID=A0A1Z4JSQ6_LEPBY|nr:MULTISPECIES: PAS domain-containing protein [Leptolyngbya]BAY59658.1 PAS/PAC sensor hybrid histidine kinase [Leptolyngbya boryana NIES-2135]MBD2371161.1 PAS domain-containing protein [Leptolyngbya sp. FACHB-161]MBD2377953.1 PAS domain-containing protein [Leptolyngbya sp. FACHB-238]MBD2402372.1 PAS domain-containing protein [Leptolyngbya sp. FACHB-239]MBD2408854.1 PAS domain-containing protein [Leptolyngbya sp. FACHB-402]
MNDPSIRTNPHLDEVNALRQRLRDLEQSHNQCQQQLQQLQQQLSRERTERKQTEAALRGSEERLSVANERFQLAAKAVNCLIYDWDLERDRVERTDGLTRILGYSLEEAEPTGQWWRDRVHPSDLSRIQEQALVTLTTHDYFAAEYRVLNKSNQYIDVLDQGLVVVRDSDGNPTRIVGSTTNISDRKQAERQLQESQRFIQQIADATPGTLYVYDMLEQCNVYVNRQIGELLGYTPEDIQRLGDQLFPQLMHPEDFANLGLQIQRLDQAQDDEIVDHEYRMRHANGEWRWLWSRNTVSTRLSDGRAHQVVGTVYDITARKQAEAELLNREQEFRTLVENTPDIVIRYDRDLRHLYINPSVERALGIPPEQFIGKTGFELGFTDERSQRWYAILQQVFETGQRQSIEYEFPNSCNELRSYRVRFVPELIQGGQVTTVLAVATDVTEYKRAELSLRQSEERVRLAMEGAQMGTWDVDLNTGKAIWSVQHFTMLGYEPVATGEASEDMWSSHIYPDDRERVLAEWQRAREEQRLYRAEYRIIRADNQQIRWLAALGSFTYDTNGLPIRSIGVLFDISDRKQVEADREQLLHELSTERAQFEAVLRQMPAGVIIAHAPSGKLILGNQQVEQIWRQPFLSANNINEYGVYQGFHPDGKLYQPEEWPLARSLMTGEIVDQEEIRFVRGDGLKGVINVSSTPVYNSHREIIAGVVIFQDVTSRKQAEESLRQSEERLRLALLVGQSGIWDWDIAHNHITWSEQIYQFHGLTSETFSGKVEDFAELIHPEDQAKVSKAIDQALRERSGYEMEFRAVHPTGEIRWLSTRGGVIFDQQGSPARMLGATIDITERKAIEVEREQLLRREQIAREQAEVANRIKDEFLAVLSHELRTPLNPILGWTRLLRTHNFDPQATDRALETIERNAKLQAQLIEDLLDVSRILQGKLRLNSFPVNLVTTIEAALETVRLSAEAKSIQIQTILHLEVGQVNGDANRLQQVVWNLLSNAIKFTPSGGRIEVRLTQSEAYAQIQVSDNGQGIRPDFLPHVFEYFCQADSSTTRQFGGLGLGLAIVRHLVELHGGRVKAESPGCEMGATFTVELPLMVSALTPDLAVAPSQETKNLKSVRILIVDDEADMRDLIRFILEDQGATVRVAASAAEALQQFTESMPDVLISDIGMPNMDGYALIAQIRTVLSKQGKTVPAIALTAYAGEVNQRQALAAGFQLHLAKPVDPEQLVKCVSQAIGSSFKPSS